MDTFTQRGNKKVRLKILLSYYRLSWEITIWLGPNYDGSLCLYLVGIVSSLLKPVLIPTHQET